MWRFAILSGAIVLALARGVSAQQRDPLKSAADALGVDHIKTLQFIASGATFTVGQNFAPGESVVARFPKLGSSMGVCLQTRR